MNVGFYTEYNRKTYKINTYIYIYIYIYMQISNIHVRGQDI